MTEDEFIKTDHRYISALIETAYQRIKSHLIDTPIVFDSIHNVWLKCENKQKTGSFKWRGALAKLSLLPSGQTIVTASTGNHGLGVAKAADQFGLKKKIFIPASAAPKKIEKLTALGVDLVQVDGDSLDAEIAGKKYAAANRLSWVSPYNDADVISGQGTIGLEITGAIPKVDRMYVTVGGGGLISGIASWMKFHSPATEIIGCQPVHSPEMYLSIQAGFVVSAPDALPTLSDGSAGPLEEDSITFDICMDVIDRFILVTENEIEDAIYYAYKEHDLTVEGAAGVALAAAMKDKNRDTADISVVVLCGGNIDPLIHKQIYEGKRVRG